jgi:hypothetical protein
MKIPKSFRVGKKKYKVIEVLIADDPTCVKGGVNFALQEVTIGHYVNRRKMGERERDAVFWHEAVHAMLKDMDSRKNNDEQFVEGLAQRITDLIYTARF